MADMDKATYEASMASIVEDYVRRRGEREAHAFLMYQVFGHALRLEDVPSGVHAQFGANQECSDMLRALVDKCRAVIKERQSLN